MDTNEGYFYSIHLKRDIRIEVDEQWVSFYFISDTRLLDDGLFYDFYKDDWHIRMKRNMQEKEWFTPAMYKFISSQINTV